MTVRNICIFVKLKWKLSFINYFLALRVDSIFNRFLAAKLSNKLN